MTRSREHGSDWKRGRAKRGSDAFLKSGGGCCACGWEPYGCGRGGAGQRSGGVALELSFRFVAASAASKLFIGFSRQQRSLEDRRSWSECGIEKKAVCCNRDLLLGLSLQQTESQTESRSRLAAADADSSCSCSTFRQHCQY